MIQNFTSLAIVLCEVEKLNYPPFSSVMSFLFVIKSRVTNLQMHPSCLFRNQD